MNNNKSKLANLSACQISDALISLGVPSGGFVPDIRPVSLPRERISGPVYTVRFAATVDKDAPSLTGHFLDHAPEGSVVFIEAPREAKNAVWGGLMSAAAKTRGVTGVVISGRCRDVSEHRSLGFPVFARGHSTVGQKPFTRPSEVGCQLIISAYRHSEDEGSEREGTLGNVGGEGGAGGGGAGFPAVVVNTGDEIVADEDGVVCVPKDLIDRVVEVAVRAEEIDKRCMEDILAGKGVQETFKLHRGK